MQENIVNSQQWRDCLQYMSQRMSEQSFNTWLKLTKGKPDDQSQFKVAVPNQFVADWIRSHFGDLIEEAFTEVVGRPYDVVYVISDRNGQQDQTSLELENNGNGSKGKKETVHVPAQRVSPRTCNLNDKYNFGSLVVGDFNQFACAAAMAVAEGPGLTKYNPLYIYGGTGLGKTHIVQAIGNHILYHFASKRVKYATSEKFTSDFITSISDRLVSDFTRVYRDVDVLIIDDIQFFTGKESTQEQFFHTFNTLHHLGKQIVLTSDRSPREIKGLEERLLSRFSWGLVTDLQAPDLENRTAILYKKLNSEGTSLSDNVIEFIADRVSTNIRELEGALIRLLAYAALKGTTIDLELAQKVLAGSLSSQKKEITIELIQKKTAELFHVSPQTMTAKKKTSDIVLARQVAMYLSRSLTDSSLKFIGTAFGGRDHSTVIHACNLIAKKMSTDPAFREKIDKISASLLY